MSFMRRSQNMLGILKADKDKYENLLANLTNDKNFEEIFSQILDLEETTKFLDPLLLASCKSDKDAERSRVKGNRYFGRGQLKKALEFYNISIRTASHPILSGNDGTSYEFHQFHRLVPILLGSYGGTQGPSITLAKAYGNRSAVMFQMKFYEECLKDIQIAFKYGYPDDLKDKLIARRMKCLRILTKSLLSDKKEPNPDDTDSDPDSNSPIDLSNNEEPEPPEELDQDLINLRKLSEKDGEPPNVSSPNDRIPVFSRSLKVIHSSLKGRHVIASMNIKTGEVLAKEDAFCHNITAYELHQYCSGCLRFCFNPFPCPSCSMVIFCSKECRVRALVQEHWLECRILPSIHALGIGDKSLAYKMLQNRTFKDLEEDVDIARGMEYKLEKEVGCDASGIYHSDKYTPVYHLCSNKKEQCFDLLVMTCQLAYMITKLLEKSERFFIVKPGEPFVPTREQFLKTGSVVLMHAFQLLYNPFELSHYKRKITIAEGLYPAMSLLNHSCSPNAKYYNSGRKLMLRALRPIFAGEDINIAYITDHYEMNYEARKTALEGYFIQCNCLACHYKWPLYKDNSTFIFKCLHCYRGVGGVDGLCGICRTQAIANGNIHKETFISQFQTQCEILWSKIYQAIKIGIRAGNSGHVPMRDYEALCEVNDFVYSNGATPSKVFCDMKNVLFEVFKTGK